MKYLLSLIFICINAVTFSQNFLWAHSFGDTQNDHCNSIKTDKYGNIYVTGSFQGTVDFDPGAGISNLTSQGNSDIFVLKLDANGDFLWARNSGGIYLDQGSSVCVDSTGNVYITGFFTGTANFGQGPATYTLSSAAAFVRGHFILKLDSNGNFIWVKQLTSTDDIIGHSIIADDKGNIYSVGAHKNITDFDPGPATYTLSGISGAQELYISKLDSTGSFIWAQSIGAIHNGSFSLMLDKFNHLYVTGSFQNTVDFDAGSGTDIYTSIAGHYNPFILKLNTSGAYVWTKTMPCTNSAYCYSIVSDNNGNIYTCGMYGGVCDFDPGTTTYTLTSSGIAEAFVMKLDSTGSLLWVNTTRAVPPMPPFPIFNSANAIALDDQNSVYVTGSLRGLVDFNSGAATDTLRATITNSMFLLRVTENGNHVSVTGLAGDTKLITIHSNDIIMAGEYSGSADFDPTAGTNTLTSAAGSVDFHVVKLGASLIGVNDLSEEKNRISIFPNPSNGLLTINSRQNANIDIRDNFGRNVQHILLNDVNIHTATVELLIPGIYYVTAQFSNEIINQKIIITK